MQVNQCIITLSYLLNVYHQQRLTLLVINSYVKFYIYNEASNSFMQATSASALSRGNALYVLARKPPTRR